MYCGGYNRKKIKAVVSEKRLGNFLQSFNWAKWDKSSAKVTIKGKGDKPQWSIKGKYKKFNLLWTSNSPGGGNSTIKAFVNNGELIKRISPAAYYRSKTIQRQLDKLK
jgi:hypothetical protein